MAATALKLSALALASEREPVPPRPVYRPRAPRVRDTRLPRRTVQTAA